MIAVLLVALSVVCVVVAVSTLAHLASRRQDSTDAEVVIAGSVWAVFAIGFLASAVYLFRWS